MNEGRIAALDPPQVLVEKYGGSQVLEVRIRSDDRRDLVLTKLGEKGLEWQEIEDILYVFQGDGQVLDQDLLGELFIMNQHVPTLEDVFLKVTGRSLKEQ